MSSKFMQYVPTAFAFDVAIESTFNPFLFVYFNYNYDLMSFLIRSKYIIFKARMPSVHTILKPSEDRKSVV